jgi:hypothetical protein
VENASDLSMVSWSESRQTLPVAFTQVKESLTDSFTLQSGFFKKHDSVDSQFTNAWQQIDK